MIFPWIRSGRRNNIARASTPSIVENAISKGVFFITDWSSYRIFVFAPYRMTDSGPESITYGGAEFREEVAGWMRSLGAEHTWVEVTPRTCAQAIASAQEEARRRPVLVFNLCDGIEADGYPGVGVVRALEASGLPFTGADSAFYELTTPKTLMKDRLLARGVSTSPFVIIREPEADATRAGRDLGFPLIVKPDVSAASFGISIRSVVHDEESCIARAGATLAGERRPDAYYEGVFAERFVPGREFTVLCASDRAQEGGVFVYPPVERVFHDALPEYERLLSYDRYWETYETEEALPGNAPICRYAPAPAEWADALVALARDAYAALGGTGYGRVDIRRDSRTGEFVALEANCNCGLSTDGQTSVSWILHFSGETMTGFLQRIFTDAVRRGAQARAGKKSVGRRRAGPARPPN